MRPAPVAYMNNYAPGVSAPQYQPPAGAYPPLGPELSTGDQAMDNWLQQRTHVTAEVARDFASMPQHERHRCISKAMAQAMAQAGA